jgi:hypothetical protein
MQPPDDYVLGKVLRATPHGEVHAALRESDRRPVVLKWKARDALQDGRSRARLELDALRKVAGPGVPVALEIVASAGGPALALEPIEGIALSAWAADADVEPDAFLKVASQLALTLQRVHDVHLLHRDIRPEHVLVDPTTLAAHLIGFGFARTLGASAAADPRSGGLSGYAGTPAYIAPEQTGRMGRGMDSRSDLYALGGTLYFMLTGAPPFEGDTLGLIHAHMARKPVSPLERRPTLPATLARIVLKLLEKEPEQRYQSAAALHRDLVECSARLERGETIADDLPLGRADRRERPVFTARLYGRDAELAALRAAYARVAERGMEILRVAGLSGSGKSALVQELRRALPRTGGRLASGRFDRYRRDVPYAGLFSALAALVHQILTESDESISRWRADLSGSLGSVLASAMVEQIPELGIIVGEVPAAPAVGPRETRSRLALAVRRFLKGSAQKTHPLVLFLDDVQWADPGSLDLLEALLGARDAENLLVVLAYRSEEVGQNHPFQELLARLEQRSVRSQLIELAPLSVETTRQMLADVLGGSDAATRALAASVARKTTSNPLLIQQFVLHVHALGLIAYSDSDGWTWDEAAVAAAPIPDGAVALMVAKLERLDPQHRELLLFASCVGHAFDTDLLAELSGRSRDALEPLLFALAEQGLLALSELGFCFVHDRVREAAQALLSEEARSRLHHQMGRHLVETLPAADRESRLFEIVEHLNGGLAHLPEELRVEAMQLNLAAGQRALGAGAAATASAYFSVARGLFRDSDWSPHWSLGFELWLASAETAFQVKSFAVALALLDTLESRPRSVLEAARVVCKRIHFYSVLRPPVETVEYALAELRKRGVRWSMQPSRLRAVIAVLKTRWKLRGRTVENILKPATSIDAERAARILIIDQAGAMMSLVNVRFLTLATSFVLYEFLRHGYMAQPGFSIGAYALSSYITSVDGKQARRLARIGLEWGVRAPDPIWTPRTEFIIHGLLMPWLIPRRAALASLEKVLPRLLELGDVEYCYYARFTLVAYGILAGEPVSSVERQLVESAAAGDPRDARYASFADLHRAFRLLAVRTPEDVRLDELQRESEAPVPETVEPEVRTTGLLVFCVYGRHDLAFAQTERDRRRVFRLAPWSHVADHTLYRGLSAAALLDTARGWSRRRLLRIVRLSARRLQQWARSGPDFEHMATLLQAELARIRGRQADARQRYQQAAQRALQQASPHHAALAHERHARMLLGLRRTTEGVAALQQAIAAYRQWGAAAKVAALEREVALEAAAPGEPPASRKRKARRRPA